MIVGVKLLCSSELSVGWVLPGTVRNVEASLGIRTFSFDMQHDTVLFAVENVSDSVFSH